MVRTPRCSEGFDDIVDEIWRGGDYHSMGVDGAAQNALDWADDHVLEFVEADGVLMLSEVRWSQEDVNCLDRGGNALFEVGNGEGVNINIVVNVNKVRHWQGMPFWVDDGIVESISFCMGKKVMGQTTQQGSIPVECVQEFPVLGAQRRILEEACGKMLKDLMDDFQVCGAEVHVKGLAAGEREFFSNDI